MKIKDRLQLIIIMKLQHQLQLIKIMNFYLGKTGKSVLELEDKGDFNLLLSNVNSNARDDVFAVDTMPQDGYDGTIMKGIYKLTGLTLDKAAIGDEINDVEIWYTNNAEKIRKKKSRWNKSI